MAYCKIRSGNVQGTVALRIPLRFQPRMCPCGSCSSLIATSWELLKPEEVMEDACVRFSLNLWKLMISFFLELTLGAAFLLAGRAEGSNGRDKTAQMCSCCVAGAMARTRAEPSSLLWKSALVPVNCCHLVIPLAGELNTEEGSTLKCLC